MKAGFFSSLVCGPPDAEAVNILMASREIRVVCLITTALLTLQGCAAPSGAVGSVKAEPRPLIAPALFLHKNSPPGLAGFTEAMDLLTGNGANLFGFTADWADLEPSPGAPGLQESFVNPLTSLVPQYPEIEGVVFVLKMIDTNRRTLPRDIKDKPFDHPEVIGRFGALIDAMAAEPSGKRITHILLGNEVDGYLSRHPDELAAFRAFYRRAVVRVHARMPGVKVATIVTSEAPETFDDLIRFGDLACYTYYPVHSGPGAAAWQMRPVSEVRADIDRMARRAGDKPFAFTEIGYSASPSNGSSEKQQALFVREMFQALERHRRERRLAFLLYHALYDYRPGVCAPYAAAQGIAPEAICGFMENLGLRRYDTNEPRAAWDAFVQGVQRMK